MSRSTRPRVALVADLLEEGWHSMDLVAEMLLAYLGAPDERPVEASRLRPGLVRRLTRVPGIGRSPRASTIDRIVTRHWDYPRWLRRHVADFDVFHVVDHSYAHLVAELPPERTIVSCHDLDAFRPVLSGPTQGSWVTRAGPTQGSWVTRALGRRALAGLQRARTIVCGSLATRNALIASDVVPRDRVLVVPHGVHPTCRPRRDPRADRAADDVLGPRPKAGVELLHVGSVVPRKRIDVLLRVFAALRVEYPDLRLIRVGADLTRAQRALAARLGVASAVTVLPCVTRSVLGAIYRRAALVLQPSEREGFGLPVAEALASGTPVVASDVPALREVGGEAVTYRRVGDVAGWTEAVDALLVERVETPDRWRARRETGIRHARRFSWQRHAHRMSEIYGEVLGAPSDARAEPALPLASGW